MSTQANIIGVPDFNKLKIIKQGVLTIPGQSSVSADQHYPLSVSITHNYGFAPSYFVYGLVPMIDWYGTQLTDQIIQFPQGIQENSVTTSAGNFYFLAALADSTNFTIWNNAFTNGTPTSVPEIVCYYTLFENPTTITPTI